MPIRLVCPSCSAALSVKDEYAGRAVKCPKCGGVIPASTPGAVSSPSKPSVPALPPPPPEPAPEPAPARNPFEVLDTPEPPKRATGGRLTGKVSKRDGSDDEDAKPSARRGRDDERDEAPPRKGRRRGDDDDARDDDRPARRRRRDADDRPPQKGGNKALMIVAVICGTLLLCCGGTGFGVYYFIIKPVKEGVENTFEEAREKVKTWNFQVSKFSYDELDVGESTRSVADTKLGAGRVATDEDLNKVFASEPGRVSDWSAKVAAKRAVVWQNSDDYVIAAFHPTADGSGRLQAKEWRPKSGASLREGELDDAKFLQQYPVGGGSGLPVTSLELAEAYKAGDGTAGDPKYKGKWLLVEGKIKEIDFSFSNDLQVVLEGTDKTGGGTVAPRVTIAKTDTKKVLGLSIGQTVKLKGKCKGFSILYVDLDNGTFSSASTDPNPSVTAATLIAEYTKDKEATDDKYSTKFLTVTEAIVESVNGETLVVRGLAKGGTKIQVNLRNDDDYKKAVGTIRVNSRVTVKGTYSLFGSSPNVNLSYAWVVPQ